MNQQDTASGILKKGGTVIFPTDTVFGIGALYKDKKAIKRIYRIKKTPTTQQFPILISSISQVQKLVEINPLARNLIKKYWPGALTIIMKSKKGSKKLGVRMPNLKITKELIEKVGPIVGTSANIHGDITPTIYEKLNPKIIKSADFVLKGKCTQQKESTVVDVSENKLVILRKGAIDVKK